MNLQPIFSSFNITALNDMQKAALETIPGPDDVMLLSPTGSGKTLAFLIPLLSLLKPDTEGLQALILVPSRELAIQIENVFRKMATGFKVNACYGGHAVSIEENNLQQAPAVLVGTPGRIAHHISTRLLKPETTHTLILDEFDKSLEAGFQDDMEFIIKHCKQLQKRILTSATALDEIPKFVGLKNSVSLNYTTQHKELASSLVVRSVRVEGDDKLEALMLLLGKTSPGPVIVFCNHREAVNRISEQLSFHKVAHGFYHGGLEQIDREKTLIRFRNGSTTILVTTDLAARGLDIPEVAVVVHYQLPATEDVMIHRNGRTARMNASGTAYFLLDTEDHLPKFIATEPPAEALPKKLVLPEPAQWQTLYIGAGKKDKINKMDVVGMLLQKGGLAKEELGRVDILDHSAYAAVRSHKISKTLELIRNEKIKNRKIKIEIAS